MYRIVTLFVLISIGLIDCAHFDVKGGQLKGPSFWSSYKAKVVELPSPTIEHIAPVHQRLVIEEKVHHPVQERLVIEEKVQHIEQPKVIEQVRVEETVKGHHNLVTATKSHHQNIVLTEHHDQVNLAHQRRHEELHQQREQRQQLRELQHYQQIRQQEQIRQQLEQQKNLETNVQQKTDEHVEVAHIVQDTGKTNVQHIEQIVQQKQERNEKLTEAEEAVAEPFPLIPKTHFTCDDKPVLPGMYADLETGCRVYHFCFANSEKAQIVQQVHQDKIDVLNNDIHHTNNLLITELPRPEQQQMKSFFCGEGTLFNQKLLICDHAVNVICPESIHYYSANLEFGKAAPEPASRPAQLVQQREITKTNQIVQVREPIVQIREQIVEQPVVQVREPVRIVQHHDAIKIVEPPKQIVQIREQHISQEPVIQVKEKIIHHEPARIVQEQVKVGHLVEEVGTKSAVIHQDRVVTNELGSFASASDRDSDWRDNRSWSTSRTVWGNLNNNNETNSSNSSSSDNSNERLRANTERSDSSSTVSNNNNQVSRSQVRPTIRRFLGEQITSNIPETKFSCDGKPFESGMYADVDTGCKIYHQCVNGQKTSFACSRGTLFNQGRLSCDFEDRVKCNETEQYYNMNAEFN